MLKRIGLLYFCCKLYTIFNHTEQIIFKTIPGKSVILFGILNWGLGHASRSVPLIKTLQNLGHSIHIAGNGDSLLWLMSELENVVFHELQDHKIRYHTSDMLSNAFLQLPTFFNMLKSDRSAATKLSNDIGANVIISDNRFSFFNKKILLNIYITHQVHIHHPWFLLANVFTKVHQHFIKKYDVCWIPDDPDIRLAGKLSDDKGLLHYEYIGLLSRFNHPPSVKKRIDILTILSGPEPQRSKLEKKLIKELSYFQEKNVVFVRGTQMPLPPLENTGITFFDLAGSKRLESFINESKLIICRPGYSTLMDLYTKNIPAILIPTPGQTEQEYLASHHSIQSDRFIIQTQRHLTGKLAGIISKKLQEVDLPKE